MSERLRVAQAGLRTGLTYQQVYRLIMKGALKGGQDQDGKWWVDAADAERLASVQGARGTPD